MNSEANEEKTREQPAELIDVAICGGGPVGLSLAYLLGREGVRVRLFEKRAGTTTLPKGQYMHAQTAELYRQWGIWDELASKGWPINKSNGQGYYINIASGPVAQVLANMGSEEDYEKKWAPLTPVYPRKIPASDYEAAICRKAAEWPNVDLNFNRRVTDIQEVDDHLTIEIGDQNEGSPETVRARYVVACDGAHSFIRNRIGKGEDNGPAFINQVLVEFEAELEHSLGKDGFFHSFVLDPRYAGWFGSKHPETGSWRYSFRHDEDDLPHPDVVLARIRGALGEPDLPVRVIRTYRFDYTTGLLRRWREGNVIFAGDAAHWHSPWGGFGANSGIQDANNLAWKLNLVIKGAASEGLLDTYEVERKSKALQTVKSATYNSLHYQSIVQSALVGEPRLYTHGQVSNACQQFLQERMKPHGDNAVLHTGYQLGTVYRSDSVISDGTTAPEPTLKDYVETTIPGTRAPHVWLQRGDGDTISTIDLYGGRFVLVAIDEAAAWQEIAAGIRDSFDLNLSVADLSGRGEYQPDEPKFSRIYRGEEAFSMVLVRPDGYIASRFQGNVRRDGDRFLQDAFRRILGKDAVSGKEELAA